MTTFRQRIFKHVPGPTRSNGPYFYAADTPYGLILNVEPPLVERIMAGECSNEFVQELAQSNLPDLTVANLAGNILSYATQDDHTTFLLNGLV